MSQKNPIASKGGRYSKHLVEQIGEVQGNLTQEIPITTQRRFPKYGKKSQKRTRPRRDSLQQGRTDLLNFRESSESTRRLVARTAESMDGNDRVGPHNLHISAAYVSNLEEVFSNVRQKFGCKTGDKMEDLDVKTSIWIIFITDTLRAAVHLGNLPIISPNEH